MALRPSHEFFTAESIVRARRNLRLASRYLPGEDRGWGGFPLDIDRRQPANDDVESVTVTGK